MKLGVTYIAFSGLELLKPSILNIRPFAHHIAVVWSKTSATGEPIVSYAENLLKDLVDSNLIDDLLEYTPKVVTNPQFMQDNCRTKREIGRVSCKNAGCTHHLIRDCDEFHDPIQLETVLNSLPAVDCSLTRIWEYVDNPNTRLKDISGLYVPFLQRIDLKLAKFRPFPVICDMGRTVENVKTWYIYDAKKIVMHHYTLVRYDELEMKRKYQGHGHCHRIGSLEQFLKWTKRFKPEEMEQVPDYFGILDYWNGEFQQWIK